MESIGIYLRSSSNLSVLHRLFFLTWNSTNDITIHDSIHRKRQWKALGYIYDRHPICRSYTGFFSLFVGTHSQSSWPVDNSFADAVCWPPKTFTDDNLQTNFLTWNSTNAITIHDSIQEKGNGKHWDIFTIVIQFVGLTQVSFHYSWVHTANRPSWPEEVDQCCLKSLTELRSCLLNQAPIWEFVERGHDHGEDCKYGHVHQATGIASA